MLVDVLSALEQSALAGLLRQSTWLYPLISAAHIAGLALLFGGIVPMDLRLLGAWPSMPVALLARVLVPTSMGGLVLAMTTGLLLFTAHAVRYAGIGVFQLKMGLVAVAVVNAVLLERSRLWVEAKAHGTLAPPVRLAAGLSLALWTAVLLAGRLVGFAD